MLDGDVAVGTLCVSDVVPRDLSRAQLAALVALGRQVSKELELRRTIAAARPSPGDGRSRSVEGSVVAGRYRVEEVIGVGGMGIVVAARDGVTGDRVAIKFLLAGRREKTEALERFSREARVMLHVGGDFVARVLDVGNLGNGAPFIVMEHLVGEDLKARLESQGPFAVSDAVATVRDACAAVASAHAVGVLHRDLKPSNLFLSRRPDGREGIKVLDFGISKFAPADERSDEDTGLTNAAAILGSFDYMSPEQMKGARGLDVRTDVWSLGVILFELLSGRLPFEASSTIALCTKVLMSAPNSLRVFRPEVPAGLEEVVMRCLAKDREVRHSSADALAVALAPFASPPRSHPV